MSGKCQGILNRLKCGNPVTSNMMHYSEELHTIVPNFKILVQKPFIHPQLATSVPLLDTMWPSKAGDAVVPTYLGSKRKPELT